MGLFTTVASDLEAARKAKTAAEAAVAEIDGKLATLFDQDGGDPIKEIADLNRHKAAQLDKIGIYNSRIAALIDKQKRAARAATEEDRRRWIAEVKKLHAAVVAAAEEADRDDERKRASIAKMVAAERKVFSFPSADFWPSDKYADALLSSLKLELKPRVQAIIKSPAQDSFAAEAKRLLDVLVQTLEETPLPEEQGEAA